MAANEPVDIFLTYEKSFLEPFVNAGKVLDLTPYLEADPEWRASFSEDVLSPFTYADRVYGIPTQTTACVVFYNREIFAEAGVSVPQTYEEFLDVCETLKAQGIVPLSIGWKVTPWIYGQFFQQVLVSTSEPSTFADLCSGALPWNCEAMLRAAEEVQSMVRAGFFQEQPGGIDFNQPFPSYTEGETAMYYQPQWSCVSIHESGLCGVTGTFAFPGTTEANSGIAVGSVDTSFAIANTCENKEAAVDFLKYLTSDAVTQRLLYEQQQIPATNVDIDMERLCPVLADSIQTVSQLALQTPWFDRVVGSALGNEYNNACLDIFSGADARATLDELQRFAQNERG